MARVSKLRKHLVFLDISQKKCIEDFCFKKEYFVRDQWKIEKLLKDIFTEFDKTSQIDNISDKLNLDELHIDDISTKFTAGSIYIPIK